MSSQEHSQPAGSTSAGSAPTHLPSPLAERPQPQQPQLNLSDLHTIAADIKDTLSATITNLCHDIQALAGRVQHVEWTIAYQGTALRSMHQMVDTHTLELCDPHLHMEDLDNRGRRHKLRIQGLPESVEMEQLTPTMVSLFTNLLDRAISTPIGMECIHRALRPRGRESDLPHDVACYLIDFRLKEEILRKAQNRIQLSHDSNDIPYFVKISYHPSTPQRPMALAGNPMQ